MELKTIIPTLIAAVNETQNKSTHNVAFRKFIGLLGLIEEANEVAQEVIKDLDIESLSDTDYSTVKHLLLQLQQSLFIGRELGQIKKQIISGHIDIAVITRPNTSFNKEDCTEELYDVLYYWLLLLNTNSVEPLHLLTTGLNKIARKEKEITTNYGN